MFAYKRLFYILGLLAAMVIYSGPSQVHSTENRPEVNPRSKITFDLEKLNADGLQGPPGGLRALHYEFCIPADPTLETQVKAIDPTIVIHAGSKGRIGCSRDEYLCLGHTHQPQFKAVLLKLAALPYVKQIRECFFE